MEDIVKRRYESTTLPSSIIEEKLRSVYPYVKILCRGVDSKKYIGGKVIPFTFVEYIRNNLPFQ